ncbi:MAG: hypothetical protein AB1632_04405 [Nitrospirota bacterium]
MIENDRPPTLIISLGYILIALAIACTLFFFWVSGQTTLQPVQIYFVAGITTWYLLTGIGVLLQTGWGYYLLKSFLYSLLLSFPFGTVIGWKLLAYMKRNNVRRYFFHAKSSSA